MKFFFLLFLLIGATTAHSSAALEKLSSMRPNHPEYPDAVVALQTEFLKKKKWEHVLAIGQIFRENFAAIEASFRVDPFLMEAYSLIQYCRYSDANAVLEQGHNYALKFNKAEGIKRIEKAKELERLSQLYKNVNKPDASKIAFSKNQLQWRVSPRNPALLPYLHQLITKVETKCL